ncbi:hypothetical protein KLP28_08855 [Nocardioidaceae bacterium]|nr:hypothetical protein KLP28_08855 [Nocardioidaceae bacterium]
MSTAAAPRDAAVSAAPEPGAGDASERAREWRRRFVAELRAQGMPGDQVSRAIRHVERRCAATGRAEPEEFGDPVRHARGVFDPGRRSTGWAWLGGAFGAALGLGLTLVVRGVQALVGGGEATLGLGETLGVVLLGGALLGVGPALSVITRPGPRHELRLLGGAVVLVAVLLLPALLARLLEGGILTLGGVVAVVVGLVVAGAAGVGLVRELATTYDAARHHDREAVREAGMVPVPRWLVLLTIGAPVLALLVYAAGR